MQFANNDRFKENYSIDDSSRTYNLTRLGGDGSVTQDHESLFNNKQHGLIIYNHLTEYDRTVVHHKKRGWQKDRGEIPRRKVQL